MKVAWFLAAPAAPPQPVDDTPSLLAELARTHHVELYDERRAHDFPWQHARQPFDVCVYELRDRRADGFVWPYLLHYPGVLRLRSRSLHHSRARALQHEHRTDDFAAEVAFDVLRIPLVASRLTVVGDAHTAEMLGHGYPDARVRMAPLGIAAADQRRPQETPVFAVVETARVDAVRRAAERARAAGSRFDLRFDLAAAAAVREGAVLVALTWPPNPEPPAAAILAMSASCAAVVYEVGVTAAWPALDPQTWQPRGLVAAGDPIVVSIDPRDEEHSLMVAFRRLAGDATLRVRLGAAARSWWDANATPAVAAAAWTRLLQEAAAIDPPARPPDWPVHLTADGSGQTRAVLSDIGVSVDFLE